MQSVQLLNDLPTADTRGRYVIVISLRMNPAEQAGILVKRKSKPAPTEVPQQHGKTVRERVYVPLEDELRAHDVEGQPVRQLLVAGGGPGHGSAAGTAPGYEQAAP